MMQQPTSTVKRRIVLATLAVVMAWGLTAWLGSAEAKRQRRARWWKGNTHTHSLWSDGDDYPEMIVDWYKSRGYDFLMLSDHNVLSQGVRWIDVEKSRGKRLAYDKYLARYGDDWVEKREVDGRLEVRLKTLEEFRPLFEQPGRFLLIQGEEITDRFERRPVHMNATNLRDLIRPQGGSSVREVMQNNVDAVLAQRKATGQPMFAHLNHPNFGYGVSAEDLAAIRGERFFEVYNGHPSVRNEGDARHAGTGRIWDICLALRLSQPKGEILYGVAVDDGHNYHVMTSRRSNPGRGWIMVRTRSLDAASIVLAMEAGDFYSSSGVTLESVRSNGRQMTVRIKPERDVSYVTRFIGTRKGFDSASRPVRGEDGQPIYATRRYSAQVGAVLAEVRGTVASYRFQGDELYVRATVVSDKIKENPYVAGEMERAWVQPVIPRANAR